MVDKKEDIIQQIAYRSALLEKRRISAEEKLWLISHPCYHESLGYPYLLLDILDFSANMPYLFSVTVETDGSANIAPCFLTYGKRTKNYLISSSIVSDGGRQLSFGTRIRSLSLLPGLGSSQFVAYSEYGKLRVAYEFIQIDAMGSARRYASTISPWLAMLKTQKSDHCAIYHCASMINYRERRISIDQEHRKLQPEDLLFGSCSFTVSWEETHMQS